MDLISVHEGTNADRMVCFTKTLVFPKAVFVLVSLIKSDVSLNSSQESLVGKDSTFSPADATEMVPSKA